MSPPKLELVDEVIAIAKPSSTFSLDKFRSKSVTPMQVETLLSELPHYPPAQARDFCRLHPDVENYWTSELCFVAVPVRGQKRDLLHLIEQDLALRHLPSGKIKRFRLALASKPYNVFFLAHVPSQNLDNSWNASALEMCEQARALWTLVVSRLDEGVEGYRGTKALDADLFGEPEWPKQSLAELIEKSFAGRMIDSENHPALLRLIGAKQRLT